MGQEAKETAVQVGFERSWGAQEAERYQRSRHGPDGKIFLDPLISAFLAESHVHGPMLDVGTGAAAVPIEAVRDCGVKFVYGIDNSPAMIAMAEKAITEAGLSNLITARIADARSLPYDDNEFHRVTSINVGCNLDPETLTRHLCEMARVVTPSGQILFAVPINLREVFSNGDTARLQSRLISALAKVEEESTKAGAISQASIQSNLGDIEELHRGTFVVREGRLRLVINSGNEMRPFTTTAGVMEGVPVWRKLPGLVVPNVYHDQRVYEEEISAAGLRVVTMTMGNFATEVERRKYNDGVPDDQPGQKLGAEYIGKGPFAVYILANWQNGRIHLG